MTASINFTFRDEKGKTSATSVNIPSNLSVAQMAEFASDLAQLISPLTRGALTNISVTIGIDIPGGVTTTPFSGSDVEEGGRFQFRTEGGYNTSLRLPTLDESVVLPNSDVLDLTDTDVSAFVTAMEDGITITGDVLIQPVDVRGDDIESLTFARETFQSSGRRRV